MNITLITGNESKAKYFEKFIGIKVDHLKMDLEEIQSLSLDEVVKHKVFKAYEIIKKPVVVEDASLEFNAYGRLPGTFIKFFLQEIGNKSLCELVKNKDKKAIARCSIGYYDGKIFKIFSGDLNGEISDKPIEEKRGFGWDSIFIPEGFNITRSQMNEEIYKKTYVKLRRIDLLKEFLKNELKDKFDFF